MQYSNDHRAFLQRMVALRCCTETEAISIFKEYCPGSGGQDFAPFVDTINRKLRPLFLSIKSGRREEDGRVYFALVNTTEDDHAKLASDYQANEIAFIKKTLERIVHSESGSVPSMELMNIGAELETKMTVSATENLLQKLVADKWLQEIDGDHSLGPRSIIELGMYLRRIFDDAIPDCKICSDFVVKGQSCGNCGIRIHYYCASRYFKGRSEENRKCPGCSVPWVVDVTDSRRHQKKR